MQQRGGINACKSAATVMSEDFVRHWYRHFQSKAILKNQKKNLWDRKLCALQLKIWVFLICVDG